VAVYTKKPINYYSLQKNPWGNSTLLTDQIKLGPEDIVVWFDVIVEEELKRVFEQNGIPGKIISTAHVEKFTDACQLDYWPRFLLENSLLFESKLDNYDHCKVEYCSNFLINKKQINRYLLLKLVEWFEIKNFTYTWSGAGNTMILDRLIEEFKFFPPDLVENLSDFKSHLLAPVTRIIPCWVDYPEINNSNFTDLSWPWNNVFGQKISQSAVSLITESLRYENYMVYTEKTLYAVHGLTFPIWIGGKNQARLWAEKGFDTFDDIINHNYQHCDTLLERCYKAIADNLQILTDLDFAREQKIKNLQRLKKNRELLVPTFVKQCEDFWSRAPAEVLNARPNNRLY
jgi:hypothetical protein